MGSSVSRPNRLLDAVVEGRLKTEELLLTVEAINQIMVLHDELVRTLDGLSSAGARSPNPASEPEALMVITLKVPKHDVKACRTIDQVHRVISHLALEAFAMQYGRIKDGEVRENVQPVEKRHEDEPVNSERVDTSGV